MSRLPWRVPGDPPLYVFARALLVGAVHAYARFEATGTANLPRSGPAILVSNHPSDIDPILLGVSFPRTLHFMADVVQFRRAFVGRVIPRLAAFPIRRGGADGTALRKALGLLAAGEVVALFPEGDMYADGTLHEFERGVGFLALRSGAPVVPAAITGSYAVTDARWRRWPQVRLTVGEPVDVSDVHARGHDGAAIVTARIESAVRELRDGGECAEKGCGGRDRSEPLGSAIAK